MTGIAPQSSPSETPLAPAAAPIQTTIRFSDLARLCLGLQSIADDYRFCAHGEIRYLIDFSVATFCMHVEANASLANLFSRETDELTLTYATTVRRILRSHAETPQVQAKLGFLRPHRQEFDISRYAHWEKLARTLKKIASHNRWIKDISQLDPEHLDTEIIDDIVNYLQNNAPEVFSLLNRRENFSINTRKILDDNLKTPRIENINSFPRGELLTESQLILSGKNPKRRKSIKSAELDSTALMHLSALNRTAGGKYRYVLITSDLRLSCLVNFAKATGVKWPGLDWSNIHVRDLSLVPLMVDLNGNERESEGAHKIQEIADDLVKSFNNAHAPPQLALVIAAHQNIFGRESSGSPTYDRLCLYLEEGEKNGPQRADMGKKEADSILARAASEWHSLHGKVAMIRRSLKRSDKSRAPLIAMLNLLIARNPPSDVTDQETQRFVQLLKSPDLMDQIDRAFQDVFSLAARTIDPPGDRAIRDYLYAAIDLKEARRRADHLAGRMPLALREDPQDSDQSIDLLNRWLAEGRNWLDFPLDPPKRTPAKLHLMTAYIYACNSAWDRAAENCRIAIELTHPTQFVLLRETNLLLAFVKRVHDRTPQGLMAASRLLAAAKSAAARQGSALDLRLESEELAQILYLHNLRRYLPNDRRWAAADLPGFVALEKLEDRLQVLQADVDGPDSTREISGEAGSRLRMQVHLNVCGYWILRWLDDDCPREKGRAQFAVSLGRLNDMMAIDYESRSYFARITYRFALWLSIGDNEDKTAAADSAVNEIERALKQKRLLAPYEREKYQKFKKIIRNKQAKNDRI